MYNYNLSKHRVQHVLFTLHQIYLSLQVNDQQPLLISVVDLDSKV